MGDSRISISLEIEGLSKSCSFVLSADISLAELMSEVQNRLLSEIKKQYTFNSTDDTAADNENIGLCLAIYDCTLSPPIDITVQVNKFCATTGPNSVTLQRLGWFPSAKLVVFDSRNNSLRDSLLQSNLHKDEDFEYNLPNGTYFQKVEKRSTVLPSQLMQVVKHRFESDRDESSVTEAQPSKPFKGRTEKERRAKLDAWLQRLDESSKKSKVSSQVRKMLIKSCAEGNHNIRVEDRFYIDTVLIDESENNELSCSQGKEEKEKVVHYFFGRSSNVGSVVSKAVSGLNIGNEKMAELLVLDRHLSDGVNKSIYRRLPNTLPIYEAERMGYIENFDRVIIRVFDMKAGGSTELLTSLFHGASVGLNNQNDITTNQPHSVDGQVASIDKSYAKNVKTMNKVDVISKEQLKFYNEIKCRIEQFDSMNQKKKSTSKVSEKVRQMLIKGRAKGNKKCHEQDRIYLEVLYFQDDLSVLSSYVFLSKFDQINKFVNCLPNWDKSVRDFTLLTEPDSDDGSNGPCYRIVPSDLKYTDAEEKGLLRSFQRIILVINHQI